MQMLLISHGDFNFLLVQHYLLLFCVALITPLLYASPVQERDRRGEERREGKDVYRQGEGGGRRRKEK